MGTRGRGEEGFNEDSAAALAKARRATAEAESLRLRGVERWPSARDVALALGVTPDTVRGAISRGELTGHELPWAYPGEAARLDPAEVTAWARAKRLRFVEPSWAA